MLLVDALLSLPGVTITIDEPNNANASHLGIEKDGTDTTGDYREQVALVCVRNRQAIGAIKEKAPVHWGFFQLTRQSLAPLIVCQFAIKAKNFSQVKRIERRSNVLQTGQNPCK